MHNKRVVSNFRRNMLAIIMKAVLGIWGGIMHGERRGGDYTWEKGSRGGDWHKSDGWFAITKAGNTKVKK